MVHGILGGGVEKWVFPVKEGRKEGLEMERRHPQSYSGVYVGEVAQQVKFRQEGNVLAVVGGIIRLREISAGTERPT